MTSKIKEVITVPERPLTKPARAAVPAPIDLDPVNLDPIGLDTSELDTIELAPIELDPSKLEAIEPVEAAPAAPPKAGDDGGTAPPPDSDYLEADTRWATRVVGHTMADGAVGSRPLFDRDAVIAFKPGVNPTEIGLSPFEAHVASFIDGGRPVARIAAKANLSVDDLGICLGMLADRGAIERVGTAMSASPEVVTTDERHASVIARLKAEALEAIGDADDDDDDDDDQTPFAAPPPTGGVVIVSSSEVQTPERTPSQEMTAIAPAGPSTGGPRRSTTSPAPHHENPIANEETEEIPRGSVNEVTRERGREPRRGPPSPMAITPKERHAKKAWKLAVDDIRTGRLTRAISHLRMAMQLAPREPLYKAMMSNWGRVDEILSGELRFDVNGKALGGAAEDPPAGQAIPARATPEKGGRLSELFKKSS